MKKVIWILFAAFYMPCALGQNTFQAVVLDSASGEPLPGTAVVVKGTTNGDLTDSNGKVSLSNIPSGKQTIVFQYIGYKKLELSYSFPLSEVQTVRMHSDNEHLDVILIEGTRSNKSIANIPTRVEVLTEEIDEASTMDPSKIAHLITHSTGIQVQQTSATSNTANVRIQGLDGRYSQILKDGFPIYGGFSGSLSIMQIPPLDLRQVEYIKGSASTLYGGGAISGLINLISKEPAKEETLLHLNGSQIGAFDINAYVSRKIGKLGFTLLGQRNTHRAFDADADGFSDMPQLSKYNLNPKLFVYFNEATHLSLGGTFTEERRQGGDMNLMENQYPDANHFYRETNEVSRSTTQLKLSHNLSNHRQLTLRNSFNIFHRALAITPSNLLEEYRFAGQQISSFSEVSYSQKHKENFFITGLNFYTDQFNEDSLQSSVLRNEGFKTLGGFANYEAEIGSRLAFEVGFRGDYVFDQSFYALPRTSMLFKWTEKLSTRIGFGMGYRNPTIFNQEAELFGYQNILPIDKSRVKAEQSYGGNFDVGYKTPLGDKIFLSFNQMFFYTRLENPIVLDSAGASGNYQFINTDGFMRSYGGETFFKLGFYDFVLFVGYTYTHATNEFNGMSKNLTLTPRHSIKGDLLYAIPGAWRIGMDYEYKSAQNLSNGSLSRSFWTFGVVVERMWKEYTFFGNVENYTNVRQTNFQSMRSGPYNTPQFTEVWAPLDGFVFNAGIKVRL